MANQEQLDRLLKEGVQAWNQWRSENPDVQIDLSLASLRGADLRYATLFDANLTSANLYNSDLRYATFIRASLRGADLSYADLTGAHLRDADLTSGANLRGANLHNANLHGANLHGATLRDADLHGANLHGAALRDADLTDADLTDADLSGTYLDRADLNRADLNRADLTSANLGYTVFGNVDLSTVKGLEAMNHVGPSTIGIDTIYRSQGKIPEVFLKEAGVPDSFIDYMRSLVGKPIDYYSCFISYSSKDGALARRLYADLQSNHVRCWFAPEDLKWGERIRTGIDEAIRLHDKLLLILWKSSVASGWVEREMKTALEKGGRRNERSSFLSV